MDDFEALRRSGDELLRRLTRLRPEDMARTSNCDGWSVYDLVNHVIGGARRYTMLLVICALALCHVPDLTRAVAECSRVLRRGGYLLITDFHPHAIVNGWETAIVRGEDDYVLPTVRHSRSAYLQAIEASGCDVVHEEEVLVRDQPEEAILRGEDVEDFMGKYGDWPFCLILLAQKHASG